MKTKMIITGLALFFAGALSAQVTLGTISGRIYDKDSITTMPFAKVWVDTESGKRGVTADIDGRYKIDALKPGTYVLHAKTVDRGEMAVKDVQVGADGITTVDVYLINDNMLTAIDIVYTPPLVEKDIPKLKIQTEDIENSPYIRSPLDLIVSTSSDVKMEEGSNQVIIRGSRPGDAVYYIDGVKMTDMGTVPGAAIGGMEAYTGGVPAKYGDTTGGVIILETKSYFDLYYSWKARQ